MAPFEWAAARRSGCQPEELVSPGPAQELIPVVELALVGAELAIGRRPAQPTKTSSAKQRTNSLSEGNCAAKRGDARSFTSSTACDIGAARRKHSAASRTSNSLKDFQYDPSQCSRPVSTRAIRISRQRGIPAIIGMQKDTSKETTCHFPFAGVTNSTAGAARLPECSGRSQNKRARDSARPAARWSAQRLASATSAART